MLAKLNFIIVINVVVIIISKITNTDWILNMSNNIKENAIGCYSIFQYIYPLQFLTYYDY